jgi:FMN phosphatase YigB (HAD superfamily)/DNA-binding XRE family transcriptional regulator
MAMDEKGLGKRLQKARQDAVLTQQELCQRSGLSYSTLAKIERGAIKSPSIFTIQKIADTIGIDLDALVSGNTSRIRQRKKSKSGVSFIYFDVNGCIVHFFNRAFTELAHLSGKPSDLIESFFWHYNDQICRGEYSVEDFNRELAKMLGIDSVDWKEYYFNAIEPIKDAYDLILWASEHYKVGLLTNSMPGFLEELMERDIVPNIKYDAIIDSSRAGHIKPELEIFKIAEKAALCKAEEILSIDDSRANLMAAEKLGWHVSWFDDYNSAESVSRIRNLLEPTSS